MLADAHDFSATFDLLPLLGKYIFQRSLDTVDVGSCFKQKCPISKDFNRHCHCRDDFKFRDSVDPKSVPAINVTMIG
jgi:hypothetical protein